MAQPGNSLFRAVALTCVKIYVSAVALSVAIAHVLLVAQPQSGFGERMMSPVARGLTFLDAHWKAVLIMIAPFFAPFIRDLVPRVRKIGSVELDPVPLEEVAARQKPPTGRPGAAS